MEIVNKSHPLIISSNKNMQALEKIADVYFSDNINSHGRNRTKTTPISTRTGIRHYVAKRIVLLAHYNKKYQKFLEYATGT